MVENLGGSGGNTKPLPDQQGRKEQETETNLEQEAGEKKNDAPQKKKTGNLGEKFF